MTEGMKILQAYSKRGFWKRRRKQLARTRVTGYAVLSTPVNGSVLLQERWQRCHARSHLPPRSRRHVALVDVHKREYQLARRRWGQPARFLRKCWNPLGANLGPAGGKRWHGGAVGADCVTRCHTAVAFAVRSGASSASTKTGEGSECGSIKTWGKAAIQGVMADIVRKNNRIDKEMCITRVRLRLAWCVSGADLRRGRRQVKEAGVLNSMCEKRAKTLSFHTVAMFQAPVVTQSCTNMARVRPAVLMGARKQMKNLQ